MPVTTNIRPPVVLDYDDKNQRETRTAISQISASMGGAFLGCKTLTGSGVCTFSGGKSLMVWATSGGGGGGGAQGGGSAAAGAGGDSGVLFMGVISNGAPLTGGQYSCGAGGAGGSNTGGAGVTGQDTTFRVNGTDFVVKGGAGGGGMLSGGIVVAGPQRPPPGTTTGPNYRATWGFGEAGLFFVGSTWISGCGGSHLLGAGGAGQVGTLGAAESGNNYGGGGAGGAANAVGSVGGAGAPGCIMFYEFN